MKTQHLLDDISGYKELLNSGDAQANCGAFMKFKDEERLGNTDYGFKTNLDINQHLKDNGHWAGE